MSINQILQESMKTISLENGGITDGKIDSLNGILDALDENTKVEMEMTSCDAALEIAESTIMGMEALEAAVLGYHKNGGMDAQSATLLHAAVESIMAPFGGAAAISKPLPSLESYEGDGGRAASTAYALEGIRETISNMWKAFTNMIGKAQAAVLKWFTTNNATISRIAKTSAALAAKAKDSEGKPVKDTLPVRRVSALVTDNKFIGLTVNGITSLSSGEISSVNDNLVKSAIEFSSHLTSISIDKPDANTALNNSVKKVRDSISKSASVTAAIQVMQKLNGWGMSYTLSKIAISTHNPESGDELMLYHNSKIPGNYVALYSCPADKNKVPVKIPLSSMEIYHKKTDNIYHKAFTASEIVTFCNALSSTASKIAGETKAIGELNKMFAGSKKAVDSVNKAAGKSGLSADVMNNIHTALSNIKNVEYSTRTTIVESRKHSANVLFAAYGFAKDSYDNLNV